MKDIIEVFRCFIDYKFNSVEARNYLLNKKNIFSSEKLIRKIYNKIRKYIYFYCTLDYSTESIGSESSNMLYSMDESLFTHDING